jgi:hypothetical protein
MQSSSDYRTRQALLLDADHLKAINSLLSKHFAPPTYTATCSDVISREFENLEGLLGYENLSNAAIVSLRIRCHSSDPSSRVWIVLDSKTQDNISLKIEEPEDSVMDG